jgi:hypothetical protein
MRIMSERAGSNAERPVTGDPARVVEELERVLRYRRRWTPDPTIQPLLQTTREQAERTNRKLGRLIELWQELVPAEVESRTSLVALRGGVLHVQVETAALIYELDRLLREGLEIELRRRFTGTLSRVKVRFGQAAS